MNEPFEIFKTMVASTIHIGEQDLEALRSFPDLFVVHYYDYGANIYLGHDSEVTAEVLNNLSKIRCSEGLRLLVLFAISNECLWLKLDQDGPTYNDFPKYDW